MKKFIQHQIDNDGSHDIEIESLTINNETCSYYYFKDTDTIQIVFWDEYQGDETKFIKTIHFDSFKEYAEKNDLTMSINNNWDYETESVFEKYERIDFDEWIYEDHAKDCLVEFVDFQILIKGVEYIERGLCDRVSRWFNLKMYNLKNL